MSRFARSGLTGSNPKTNEVTPMDTNELVLGYRYKLIVVRPFYKHYAGQVGIYQGPTQSRTGKYKLLLETPSGNPFILIINKEEATNLELVSKPQPRDRLWTFCPVHRYKHWLIYRTDWVCEGDDR